MTNNIYDFNKIFSMKNLEDATKRDAIGQLGFGGFLDRGAAREPDGIVFNYDVDAVKREIGLATGTMTDTEKEFKRSGFNAIGLKEK